MSYYESDQMHRALSCIHKEIEEIEHPVNKYIYYCDLCTVLLSEVMNYVQNDEEERREFLRKFTKEVYEFYEGLKR